jgi:metallopeptidase MepB
MTSHLDLVPPKLPPLFNETPESLIKHAEEIVKETRRVWDAVVSTITPQTATLENVIFPTIRDENDRLPKSRLLRFYNSTSPTLELREASRKADQLLSDLTMDLYARNDMYQLVVAVLKRNQETDSETQNYLYNHHRRFLASGVHLPFEEHEVFQEGWKRINDITRECKKNLGEDVSGLWLGPHELEGVSPDFIQQLEKGDGQNTGKLWVSTKRPHFEKVIKQAVHEATRKRVFITNANRMLQNEALLRELIPLRHRMALLLGYKDHATFKIAHKMVKTPEVVNSFLDDLKTNLVPAGKREVDGLIETKLKYNQKHNLPHDPSLYYWDRDFYTRIRDEESKSIDLTSVLEYFELDNSLARLMEIYEYIFSIKFLRITEEIGEKICGDNYQYISWHDDVKPFMLWDTRGDHKFLGYLYYDLHPREGKFTHAGHYMLELVSQSGVKLHIISFSHDITRDIQKRMVHDHSRRLPS